MSNPESLKRTLTGAAAVAAAVALLGLAPPAAAEAVSFREDVFPILQMRCLECHQPGGAGYEAVGLDLRGYEELMKGTRFGAIIVPGRALTSNLNAIVEGRTEIRMPHKRKKLSNCEILTLRKWVSQGAKDN